ncbi:MAG: DUF6580 family putative transport protein [Bacteroidota bacterium]
MLKNTNVRIALMMGLMVLAAFSRLQPYNHEATWQLWNFTPIAAIALFGGMIFGRNKLMAFALPLAAMLLSDVVLAIVKGFDYGFYGWGQVVNYSCFAAIVAIGLGFKNNVSVSKIAIGGIAGSALFFVVSNFATWAFGTMYTMDLSGLMMCYAAAIPFAVKFLGGTMFYSAVLFGAYYFAQVKSTSPVENRIQA